MKKISSKSFYDENIDITEYKNSQVKRHELKLSKKRKKAYYQYITDNIPEEYKQGDMICLGTRNNNEKDMFNSLLENANVFSLDISGKSNADYVMSFNSFEDVDWKDKWDIIYSNSLDHAPDATQTFFEWIDILNPEGLLIIDFDFITDALTTADCTTFDRETVMDFLTSNGFEVIKEIKRGETNSTFFITK